METASPMVNGKLLPAHLGQRVSALGLVVRSDQQILRLRLSDNIEVDVHMPAGVYPMDRCTEDLY